MNKILIKIQRVKECGTCRGTGIMFNEDSETFCSGCGGDMIKITDDTLELKELVKEIWKALK